MELPSPNLIGFCVFLLVANIVVLIFALHKIRRIYFSTFTLNSNVELTRDLLFSQIQGLFALERLLAMNRALPSMRGWAGSPDFLLRIAEEILERKPTTIMECSSGVSTVVAARALQLNGHGHVYSLEHNTEYAARTRALLTRYNLSEWASVVDAPLTTTNTSTMWYSEDAIPLDMPPIDILIVDGPPSAVGRLARYPAMPRLEWRMSNSVLVVVDDAARSDEKLMLSLWKKEFPMFVHKDAHCEKGCILLERKMSTGA